MAGNRRDMVLSKKLSSLPEGSTVTVTVQRALLDDADREVCPVCMDNYDGTERAPVIAVCYQVCRCCATLLGDGPCVICRRRGIIFGESKEPSE